MNPITVRVDSPVQALIVEQALAFAKELESQAQTASDGTVLASLEGVALTRGRDFLRHALQVTLQAQADGVEKKGRRRVPVRADSSGPTKALPSGRF